MSCDCDTKKYQFEPEVRLEGYRGGFGDWTSNAQTAMTENPAYFEWWDRWKTVALVTASVALLLQVASRPRRRSRR